MPIVISRQVCFVPIVVPSGSVWPQSAWTHDIFVQLQHLTQRDRAMNAARLPDQVQQIAVHEASMTKALASVQGRTEESHAECLTGELVAHAPDPQSETRCTGSNEVCWSSPRRGLRLTSVESNTTGTVFAQSTQWDALSDLEEQDEMALDAPISPRQQEVASIAKPYKKTKKVKSNGKAEKKDKEHSVEGLNDRGGSSGDNDVKESTALVGEHDAKVSTFAAVGHCYIGEQTSPTQAPPHEALEEVEICVCVQLGMGYVTATPKQANATHA